MSAKYFALLKVPKVINVTEGVLQIEFVDVSHVKSNRGRDVVLKKLIVIVLSIYRM